MAKVNIEVVATDRASGTLHKLGGMLGNILTTAAGFVAAQVFTRAADAIVGFATDSIEAASDLNETLSKTYQIFGETLGEDLVMWSERAAQAVGLSQRAALDGAAGFGIFGKAAGLAGDDLIRFSEENLGLASDLASFFNTSVEDATVAIQAAFRGETEPIRRYGVLLDDASLRQEALAMGIISTTKEALTPQQRVLAVNSLLWKQTSDAQGDFARTSQGYANQQKIFNAQLEDAKAQLGQAFLPILTKVMQFLNTEGIPALSRFIEWLKTLPDVLRSSGGAFEPLRAFFGFLGNWWTINSPGIIGAAQRIGETLVSAFGRAKEIVLPFINDVLGKLVTWLRDNGGLIQTFSQAVADAFEFIVPIIVNALGIVTPLLLGLVDVVLGLVRAVMQIATGDWQGAWETVRSVAESVLERLKQAFFALLDTIARAMGSSWNEIARMWENNWRQLVEIVGKIKDIIVGKVKDFIDVGKQIVNGIKDGFLSGVSSAIESIKTSIGNIIAAAKKAAGIQSPSKAFAEIGDYMMQGLAKGLSGGVSVPVNAVVGATQQLASASLAAGGGGGGVSVVVNYSSMLSLGNESEIRSRLIPIIIQGVQEAKAQGRI